ncbi:transposase [Sphingobium sufflavum]|uniref:transposase n=1 Tax=Sphingobium sufflavum TaxID=1129547 RepID=UPI001F304742|nr:transposase [Sphingobium sufflavum]MCE7795235.1 transposase [Sphingobium sufflavum]
MPVVIDHATDAVATLADLADHCRSAAFDPQCRDSLAAAAPMLAALGNDRRFLSDLALASLKDACREQSLANGYSPQVLMLVPPVPGGSFFIRANIWPSEQDAMLRDSSRAAYYYNRPHDHAFDFLTLGYAGPGYWSDYYEYDGVADGTVQGVAGEAVDLRFIERSHLEQGKLMLYRANVDIHDQLPPDAMSVSINVMPMSDAQAWRRQYFFDLSAGRIEGCATITAAEILLPLSVRFGGGNARDLAEDFAVRHGDPRMRLAAWKALEGQAKTAGEHAALAERARASSCPLIRAHVAGAMETIVNGSKAGFLDTLQSDKRQASG